MVPCTFRVMYKYFLNKKIASNFENQSLAVVEYLERCEPCAFEDRFSNKLIHTIFVYVFAFCLVLLFWNGQNIPNKPQGSRFEIYKKML